MTESEDAEFESFSCLASDPSGAAYSVDVVPMFGAVSRVFIGTPLGGRPGPALRAINWVLARVQREPDPVREAIVIVYRVVGKKSEDIHDVPVRDFEEGRSTALAIAAQIRAGTFKPER